MKLWRIATATRAYGADDLTGKGAALHGGRWNADGEAVLYCAPTAAMAVLETAAHIETGGLPLNRFLVEMDIPDKVWAAAEMLDIRTLDASWAAIPPGLVSVSAGSAWWRSLRTALLLVPSVIVPEEFNVVINVAHPDATRIRAKVVRKFEYDALFRPAAP